MRRACVHGQMKHRLKSNDPLEEHRAVFLQCGMAYGRSYGSKGAYARNHRARFFIANASVFTGNGRCVWRGDLDLAAAADRDGLIHASDRLRRKLHVLREFSWPEQRLVPRAWLAASAVVTVWRGRIQTVGDTKHLHGDLGRIIQR